MSDSESIKIVRIKKGISQTKMAESIGMSQPGYAKIESGDTKNISLSLAVKIAQALGVGFNELYDIDGDSKKIEGLQNEIEQLKKQIIGLEDRLNDKQQIIVSYEGTINYWNLFRKYAREIIAEDENISALDMESRVMSKIHKENGPFYVSIDENKNWSFSFPENKNVG